MAENGKVSLLETIADIFEKIDKYVGIIAAIIAALTFAQGDRVASYVFVIIGYALMASFLWRVITQKSVVRRVIATVRPLPEKREYSYPRSQRWIAGIALAVLTLFSFGWVGVNRWRDYRAGEGLLFPRAKENELLVIIAQFDNRSTKSIDPTQRIYDKLRKELEEAGITNARLEIAPKITNLDEAKRIGDRHGAILVIWGWFDDLGFAPKFTTVKEKPFVFKTMELEEVSFELPTDFSLYIREGLPAQVAYFSTLTIGQVYYWDDKYEEALKAFDRAIENAEQGGISEGLADVYFYQGHIHWTVLDDPQRAMADYEKAIELQPDYPEVYFNRGAIYSSRGDYDKAVADFTKVIDLKPDKAEAYLNRGVIYFNESLYDEAIADFTKVIALEPEDVGARFWRGIVHASKGDYEWAMADYDKAIELNPDYAEVYVNRAAIYDRQGNYSRAITDYDKAIELKPDYADAHLNRGALYSSQGNYDKAITDYDKAIELDPDNAFAYRMRGLAYGAQGHYKEAIADCTKAIEIDPTYSYAYLQRGGNYSDDGQYEQALQDYAKVIELDPDYPLVYYYRGITYRKMSDVEAAIRDFEQLLKLSEDDEHLSGEAERNLRELREQ